MMDMQNQIYEIQRLAVSLRQNQMECWKQVNEKMGDILLAMTQALQFAEAFIQRGEEFPMDVVIQQVQNLNQAYENQDYIMLADTLQYEIVNTLYVCMEEEKKLHGISGK